MDEAMGDTQPTRGWIADGVHHLPLRVYYEDTDASGIVYHARYLHFFERARTEFLRCLGIERRQMVAGAKAHAFAVRGMSLDYRRPARLARQSNNWPPLRPARLARQSNNWPPLRPARLARQSNNW
ncbi:MAG: YbgC/FadM family acyl-CoA thioesterase, partial [Pseudomonadota bacterium]